MQHMDETTTLHGNIYSMLQADTLLKDANFYANSFIT